MNYELAKKLKDAGYKFIEMIDRSPHCYYCGHPFVEINDRYYIVPTLSELIEVLTDTDDKKKDFLSLRVLGKFGTFLENRTWRAESYGKIIGDGLTPEEAVANLWLALNGKRE